MKVTNGHIHEILQKTYFLSQLLSQRLHVKTKIMANSMRTAWRHFRALLTHFRSRDVINIIFGITVITPLFFKLKTSSETKMILDVISNGPNHKNDRFLQKNGRKTSFKNVTMVTKMLYVYISVTVPDRPIVAIINR